MDEKRILCIIPARGGSKRFPRKNVALLKGKPIIAYSIEEAIKSGVFDRIVVSTEDEEIAKISEKYGVEVLERPPELASDTARVPQVCLHAIEEYEKKGETFDILCILLPTSPLRKAEHIIEAVRKFINSNADYLMSTTDYRYSPFQALEEENGFLKLLFEKKYLRRDQDNPRVVVDNGSTTLVGVEAFKRDKTYYGEKLIGYHMDFEVSIDINEPVDLKLAEFFMNIENKKAKHSEKDR